MHNSCARYQIDVLEFRPHCHELSLLFVLSDINERVLIFYITKLIVTVSGVGMLMFFNGR